MKNIAFILTISVVLALPLAADETYRFKVSVSTLYEALGKQMSPEQLDARYEASPEAIRLRMKTDKVVLFENLEGAHWKYGFSSCSKNITDCEIRVNDRGFAGVRGSDPPAGNKAAYDLGFTVKDDRSFGLRCLRTHCWVRFKKADDEGELSLLFLESGDVPAEAEIELIFPIDGGREMPQHCP